MKKEEQQKIREIQFKEYRKLIPLAKNLSDDMILNLALTNEITRLREEDDNE